MSSKANKGVYLCRGNRIHVVYNNTTLHFDFDEFERYVLMVDEAYYRLKNELNARDESFSDDSDDEADFDFDDDFEDDDDF
jgi:hypothetical protein